MATLTIGQDKQFSTVSAAVAASRDGDVLAVDAGTYTNDFATINTKIKLQGVGGVAKMVATEAPGNGKGILVTNTDVTIDRFEFSGTTVPDGNGAGIRYQDGNLTITNSYFHDNQNGLLANPAPSGSITIRNSEFSHNGAGDGYTHNLYVGEIGSLTVSDSYFHGALVGHQIKSRADNTTITNSRIADGADGTGSYSIDLPNGGVAVIRGNLIEQGASSGNPVIIAFGEEGNLRSVSTLEVSGNTFLNDMASPSVKLLWNATSVTAILAENSVNGLSSSQYGTGPMTITGMTALSSNPGVNTSAEWAVTTSLPPALDPAPALEPAPRPEAILAGVPLTIKLGADSWLGDPVAIVTVNGETVFNGTIAAQRATGGQLVQLGSVDASKFHQVSVQLTNDAWGGTATTDRNLYVEGIQVNGIDTGQSQALMSNGTASFTVEAAQLASPVVAGQAAPTTQEPTPAPMAGIMVLGTSGNDNWIDLAEWDTVTDFQTRLEGSDDLAFDRALFSSEADVLAYSDNRGAGDFANIVFDANDQLTLTGVYETDVTTGDLLFA